MILFFLQPSFFCLASYIYVYLASVLYGLLNRLATKQFLNMYCEGPLVGEMGTGRNPTFGYHYHQILKYGQSLTINEEIFYKILPIFELPIV